MRYRGFIIEPSADEDVAICSIFTAEDKDRQFPLDEISLAIGKDNDEQSDQAILPYAIDYIDKNILDLLQLREETRNRLLYQGLWRAVCFIGEFQSGKELYDTLKAHVGLSDDDIRKIGYKSLVPFFDKESYAQTIAGYMIDEGTERTESGNYHFSFAEINERFGTSLPGDKKMLDKIVSSLDSEIVADVNTTEDFDLMFYPDYCPYAEDDEELDDIPTQQM